MQAMKAVLAPKAMKANDMPMKAMKANDIDLDDESSETYDARVPACMTCTGKYDFSVLCLCP